MSGLGGIILDKFPDSWGGGVTGSTTTTPSTSGSSSSLGSILGVANSLFGSSSSGQSSGGAGASSTSGIGAFSAKNTYAPVINKRLINLSDPVEVIILAALLIGGIYVFRKYKK